MILLWLPLHQRKSWNPARTLIYAGGDAANQQQPSSAEALSAELCHPDVCCRCALGVVHPLCWESMHIQLENYACVAAQ